MVLCHCYVSSPEGSWVLQLIKTHYLKCSSPKNVLIFLSCFEWKNDTCPCPYRCLVLPIRFFKVTIVELHFFDCWCSVSFTEVSSTGRFLPLLIEAQTSYLRYPPKPLTEAILLSSTKAVRVQKNHMPHTITVHLCDPPKKPLSKAMEYPIDPSTNRGISHLFPLKTTRQPGEKQPMTGRQGLIIIPWKPLAIKHPPIYCGWTKSCSW